MKVICPYCGHEFSISGDKAYEVCPNCANVVKVFMEEPKEEKEIPDESWSAQRLYRWAKEHGIEIKWPISQKDAWEIVKQHI